MLLGEESFRYIPVTSDLIFYVYTRAFNKFLNYFVRYILFDFVLHYFSTSTSKKSEWKLKLGLYSFVYKVASGNVGRMKSFACRFPLYFRLENVEAIHACCCLLLHTTEYATGF